MILAEQVQSEHVVTAEVRDQRIEQRLRPLCGRHPLFAQRRIRGGRRHVLEHQRGTGLGGGDVDFLARPAAPAAFAVQEVGRTVRLLAEEVVDIDHAPGARDAQVHDDGARVEAAIPG
mgnify:CR=1 FL=1